MSSFGTFKFGDADRFGSEQVDANSLSIARSIMSRFHSGLVVNKDSEDTLQFRYILALSRGINTMYQEAVKTYNDNFLPTSRVEHIQDVWGVLMGIPFDNSKSLAQNIEFYQGLIKIFLAGSEFEGQNYSGTHVINVIVAVYLFTQITGVRVFENWRDGALMLGGQDELFEIGAMDPDSGSYFGGPALIGPAGIPARSGQVGAGAQIVVPLDNFSGANTDGVITGKELVRPATADFAVVYELTDIYPGGVDPLVVFMDFGRGSQPISPLPTTLAFKVFRTAVFQTYVDANWLPVSYKTKRKRYFAIVDRELVYGLVPITEAALCATDGTILKYRTFSAINKSDDLDVLLAWNIDFT